MNLELRPGDVWPRKGSGHPWTADIDRAYHAGFIQVHSFESQADAIALRDHVLASLQGNHWKGLHASLMEDYERLKASRDQMEEDARLLARLLLAQQDDSQGLRKSVESQARAITRLTQQVRDLKASRDFQAKKAHDAEQKLRGDLKWPPRSP